MRVVFVQKFVPHYRLPFFERVRHRLAERGDELVLLHGLADPFEGSKVRTVSPEWAIEVATRHLRLAGRWLYWMGVWRHLRRGDTVVVEHAAKLLDNYPLFVARQLGLIRIAYFGHGRNFQASEELGLSAFVKRMMLRRVDRWFAYTSVSERALLVQGVNPEIVTVVNNTLERPANRQGVAASTGDEFLFVGGLYAQKLLPLLIESAALVAAARPSFVLHVVGEGPEAEHVQRASVSSPWMRVHGALYGEERERLFARCRGVLMPGLVGLVAIDSFQLACPLIASEAGEHSPEIAYVVDDENALVVVLPVTARRYADAVLRFMDDPVLRARLVDGCKRSAERYSIDSMAERFVSGIDVVARASLSPSSTRR